LTSGSFNTSIGANAGVNIYTGSNNSIFGYNSQLSTNTDSNEIVIGSDITGNGTNTTTIANTSNTDTYLYGTIHAYPFLGPTTAPSGSCGTNGLWDFSQDGNITFCVSSQGWTPFLTLTTVGTSGSATLSGNVLNIPTPSNGFTSNCGTLGCWEKTPTGHIHQWGTASVTTGGADSTIVLFPTAFSNVESIVITATAFMPNGDTGYCTIDNAARAITQFGLHPNNETPVTCMWQADGY
jgi:hypothetical protein